MNLRNALMAAAMVAAPLAVAPATVQAQALDGIYLGAGAGINWMTDTKINPGGAKMKSDGVGFVGLGSVGYGFGNGFRVELEGNYRYQPVKIGGATGHASSYGPMVNALYDFDAGFGSIMPYVGVGVGYQWGDIKAGGGRANSKGAWAAQGILGAAFPIADVPGLAVTAEARVMSTIEKVRYNGGNTDPQMNISGLIGLRYAFGAAPAPMAAPAAVPAPAPARTYLVFFDWDKADLTPRARQIIADAAKASTSVATTRIEVGGHADRTGTAAYNQQLSMRRAQAVAAELVRLGVARNSIDINAYGDTRPLVATAANTREPQNRRVEIVLK
jgi:outer membrane protein OmpA-like peptidoglycan-associated protein